MYVLGIDIGTTGTKAMLIDSHGRTLKSCYQEYDLITPVGFVEQDARDWWKTVVTTVRGCINGFAHTGDIAALSMSTQGGSLVLVDENCEPLHNAITWMDNRGREQLEIIAKKISETELYRISGWRPGVLCASKLLWLRMNAPELIKKAHKALTTVDFVNYKMTGRYAIDQTNAGITQLFDMNTVEWSESVLSAIELSPDLLPELVPTGEVVGTLTPAAAAELGLHTGVKVISGAHDQYAAATGADAVNDGDVLLSTGTAWVPVGISSKPMFDDASMVGVGNHTVKGLYGILCTVPAAGVSLEWMRKNFARQRYENGNLRPDSFAEIDIQAAKRRDKTHGLFFFPHWNGSTFPRWGHNNKASFIGFSLEHDFYDQALAVMEGVTFEMAQILDGYSRIGTTARSLKLVGGASKSPLWTEIISNVTGLPITKFKEAQIACIGAAAIAGAASGVFASVSDVVKSAGEYTEIPAPTGELREYYAEKYARYQRIIPVLEELYNSK